MRTTLLRFTSLTLTLCGTLIAAHAALAADDVLPPIDQRFARENVAEVPDFQQHIIPLVGRLGCNGRACHGSFQGQGGFRLSLFGYDFKADHDALTASKEPRVDVKDPDDSLIVFKPTNADEHEGGLRYKKGNWEHHVIRRWIEDGAKFNTDDVKLLTRLEIVPPEVLLNKTGQKVQLKAIAVWANGTKEDVTPLCRFTTNNEQVAAIDEFGSMTANESGDTHVVVSYDNAVVAVPVIRPVSDLVGPKYPKVPMPTKVDQLVVEKLKKLGVVPSQLCTDEEFLRRVSLDMTGTLPTAQEVQTFLADTDPNKRSKKIDELLETPAYAAWWTTKLCDFTGNNEQQLNNISPVRGSASKEWYQWINKRVTENVPYDDLCEGIVAASSRQPGQSFTDFCKEMTDCYREDSGKTYADLPSMTYYWQRRDFTEIEARAVAFAYSFMGIRIQCAQCHKHPFDQWSKDDFHQFKNFFATVTSARNAASPEARKEYDAIVAKLGITSLRGNELRTALPNLIKQGKTVPFPEVYVTNRIQRSRNPDEEYPMFDKAKLLGGDVVDIQKSAGDPRKIVMDWLRQKDNRFFASAFVNRVWASYFNVGIVEPPDDLSLANPPSNKALLDYLAQGFVENKFDMKWVHRTIANSRTYQASWQPNETNRMDEKNFSRAVPRRLPAEIAYDAIQQATASDQIAATMRHDVTNRAIAIPAASARNQANAGPAYALSVFGRSIRETNCDCDRSMEPSLLQTVFLQNDRDMLTMIDRTRAGWLDQVARESKAQNTDTAELVRQAYLRSLSRYPTDDELSRSVQYIAESSDTITGLRGVLWALLNTKEFIVNH
jgi:hypothetical protein